MHWRKINRVLHRDIGYLFFGMSIIYGVSGIALNHIDDWDPSYAIRNEAVTIESGRVSIPLEKREALEILEDLEVDNQYKSHYYPSDNTLKIFVSGGSVTINTLSGEGKIETISRRPVFFEFNYLHYNNPGFLWTWFADFYGGALMIMATTGLFMIQGKKGLSGRGKWYVTAGIIIPAVFLLFYL